jgi:Helix-turn-helix domain
VADHNTSSLPAAREWHLHWGRLLRTARQVAGLSLANLSAATGLSKGYLSKLESGHVTALNPSRATLAALARALPSFGPLAHTLQPDQAAGALALGGEPPAVPAFLTTPELTIHESPVRLGWRELEVVVALLALDGAALTQPLTARALARALGRRTVEVERTLQGLVHMRVIVHRAPARVGGGMQYARSDDFEQRVGIAHIGDVLVLAAALLAQSPRIQRRAEHDAGTTEQEALL